MATFKVPSQASRSVLTVDTLLGVDMTNDPSNVDKSQSPNGQNLIRDVPGKVRKCMGYEKLFTLEGAIHGYHGYGEKPGLLHAGTKLYRVDLAGEDEPELVYSDAADRPSRSWQLAERLFLADGKALLVYDGETVKKASEIAKIPLFTIAKAPAGGGKQYEQLNLLQPKFQEMFLGTEDAKEYHLSFSGLDSTAVVVEVLSAQGDWVKKSEGNDFSVNRQTGVVTFTTAPGPSPVSGQDNVRITAARTVAGYADRINKCDIGILFGVNGAADRLFLSGNPDYPSYDWYSGQNDPTYWPDTGYSTLGSGGSAVMGYSIINNYLAAHKDERDTDRNVVIRRGDLVDNQPAFPITNTLQGPGAVAKGSFCYLCTEPVFLTALGIYAITPSDISGERYSQDRSYYVNGALTRESGLAEAVAAVFRDLYWLCMNGHAYILDGLQSLGQERSEPYSTRQYACFYRTNLPASAIWVENDRLFFGDSTGAVYRFYDDPQAQESYNDDGQPIHAVWETPDFSGKLFYKNKTFRYLALQLTPAVATSVKLYAQKRGIWKFLREETRKARYFSYASLIYSKFTYSNDQTTKTLHTKLRIKRVDKARFRFENDQPNEPFGLMAYALEYVENGNYKG